MCRLKTLQGITRSKACIYASVGQLAAKMFLIPDHQTASFIPL